MDRLRTRPPLAESPGHVDAAGALLRPSGRPQGLRLRYLGLVPYSEARALQERVREERLAGTGPDTLLLLEHLPVVTLGRSSRPEHLLVPVEEFARRGIAVERTERGGAVTYHGPGQLVVYPIVHLGHWGLDLHGYLRLLEEAALRTLADYGVQGRRNPLQAGVWVGEEKIASIGVHVRRWVTAHGLALNVDMDLAPFQLIQPCGLEGCGMTSLALRLGRHVSVREVGERYAEHFSALCGRRVEGE
jgi:lipoyl(octanoyl) transferase